MWVPRLNKIAYGSILSLVFLLVGAKAAFALENTERTLPKDVTVGSPFIVTAKFQGNGSPVAGFRLELTSEHGATYSDCFVHANGDPGDPWPAINEYQVLATFSTSSWVNLTEYATDAVYVNVQQFSDSTCSTYYSTINLFANAATAERDTEVNISPAVYENNIFPLLDLSTSTNALLGINNPDQMCAGFGTTSTGWLDNIGAMFVRGMCVAATTLFVPSTDALNSILNVKSTLLTKVPFGYFSAVSSTAGEISNQAASTSDVGFTIGNQYIPTTTIKYFNPSEVEEKGSSIFSMIRTVMTAIIGLGFILWAWSKRKWRP